MIRICLRILKIHHNGHILHILFQLTPDMTAQSHKILQEPLNMLVLRHSFFQFM